MEDRIGEGKRLEYGRNEQRMENKRPSNLNRKENLIVLD